MKRAKHFLSILLTLCMLLGLFPSTAYAANSTHPFTDVNEADWFSDAVQYVYQNGLMNGTGNTIFSPNGPITRGQIVTILHRLEGTPSSSGASFADVPNGEYYANAVAWSSANGIMGGYGGGLFGPTDPITREQLATTMYRYAQHKGYNTTITGNIAAFYDGGTVSSYAVDAVNWAIGVGLLTGMGNNMFAPTSESTRAQAATILMRFCENIVSSGKDTTPSEDTTSTGEYHTVTFDYNYGNQGTYDTISVEHGKTVASPTNPTRSGYTFNGWYTAASGGSKYDFSTAITSDLTLYAHWTAKSSSSGGSNSGGGYVPDPTPSNTYYTVTFDSNGGSTVASQTVSNGVRATRPADPTKDGYTFTGWYVDRGAKIPFDFTTAITSNITLYAGWDQRIDNRDDGIIDRGDIEAMLTEGDIDVIFDENGNIRTIDGHFTDATVKTPADAANVLNSAASLFGSEWYFSANTKDITGQSAGDSESEELFFRYSPTVSDIPVLGSQVIISANSEGDVNGLYSTYNPLICGVNTTATISSEDAIKAAIYALISSDGIQAAIAEYLNDAVDSKTRAELEQELAAELSDTIPQLMVYAVDDSESPSLVYAVTLSDVEFGNELVYDADGSTELANSIGNPIVLGELDNMPDGENPAMLPINSSELGESGDESYIENVDMLPIDSPELGELDNETDTENVNVLSINSAELGEPDDEPDVANAYVMLSIDSTYYVYANGAHAGEICAEISNNLDWTSYYLTSPDLKGNRRTYIGQEENDIYRLVDSTRNIETYAATETSTGHLWWKETAYVIPGDIVTSSFNTFGISFMDKSAVSAHANMEQVYDYYLNTLHRRSYDGFGKKIIATVGYYYDDGLLYDSPSTFTNACWIGGDYQQFVFGKGKYEAAVDVMGHEFTHAVISYVVGNGYNNGLIYQSESGALNESYADIMGALIEGKSGNDKWLLAEDSNRTIRSMSSPSRYGQPEHYSNFDTDGDVHDNSGIFNFAAYKMMTDSRTSRISEATWANVFYRSLFRLTTNATFLDARGAVIASAKALGFTAEQQQAIKDAFDSVGITEPDAIRIVLTWGATPSDLDSHLVGPGINGGERFHTAYYQRTYYADGSYSSVSSRYAVDLDYDDTTSYGPEVTTIHILTPGEYYFYVHDFSNGSSVTSTEMANSGATVKVYRGSSSTPISNGTFTVDRSSSGTYWNVFKLTIGADRRISIEGLNTYGATEMYS